MNGKKFDTGKLRWDLVPIGALENVVRVLTYGAIKYGPNNWQGLANFKSRYYAAVWRHLRSWVGGEKIDPESGLPHLAHAACGLLFLLSREVGFDAPLEDEDAYQEPEPTTSPSPPATDDAAPSSEPTRFVDIEAFLRARP